MFCMVTIVECWYRRREFEKELLEDPDVVLVPFLNPSRACIAGRCAYRTR